MINIEFESKCDFYNEETEYCAYTGEYCVDVDADLCCKIINKGAEKRGNDTVLNPSHYTSHPSGVECIEITEHMDFLTGNAMKYIWRAGLKEDKLEDLKKAKFYIERLITNLTEEK